MTTEFDDLAQNGAQNEDELCRDIQMSLPDAFWALDYVERYKSFSSKPHECEAYARTIDGYLKMIERNNKVIAAKYAKR